MKSKGIILAGGKGTRLSPLTITTSKQLLPVYNKPMICYPLQTLIDMGIEEILIISANNKQRSDYMNLFKDVEDVELSYIVQPEPKGIAEAFILAEDWLGDADPTLILGDNIFINLDAGDAPRNTIFSYEVNNPSEYGVVEMTADGTGIESLEEKPEKPKSNHAVVGLYKFDNYVCQLAKELEPSARGELEIIDLIAAMNHWYVTGVNVNVIDSKSFWFDCGSFDSLHECAALLKTISKRTNNKIGYEIKDTTTQIIIDEFDIDEHRFITHTITEPPTKKNYLVTGGCGFIGRNLVKMLVELRKDYNNGIGNIHVIDYLGIGSNKEMIDGVMYCNADICDKANLNMMFNFFEFDVVLHLAAESHVDRSIEDSTAFIHSNVEGTQVVLDMVKKYNCRMVHVSTDEVYGDICLEDVDLKSFNETSMIRPNSPYAASKAASDLLVQSYISTHGVNAIITRCCNNYGPGQHDEKFIPTVIRSLKEDKKIPVYGNGLNVREWIHVDDHCHGILQAANLKECSLYSGVVHIYSLYRLNNLQVIDTILAQYYTDLTYEFEDYVEYVDDRKGHDSAYLMNTAYGEDHEWTKANYMHRFNSAQDIKFTSTMANMVAAKMGWKVTAS